MLPNLGLRNSSVRGGEENCTFVTCSGESMRLASVHRDSVRNTKADHAHWVD